MTCEFTAPTYECSYLCFPVLDASCPSVEELKDLAKRILNLPKPVLIHCAQGHGRTGLVASAVLFESGKINSPEAALALVQAVRPGVELNANQKQVLLSLKVPPLSN